MDTLLRLERKKLAELRDRYDTTDWDTTLEDLMGMGPGAKGAASELRDLLHMVDQYQYARPKVEAQQDIVAALERQWLPIRQWREATPTWDEIHAAGITEAELRTLPDNLTPAPPSRTSAKRAPLWRGIRWEAPLDRRTNATAQPLSHSKGQP